jgi:glycerophosphoryl diester phosphodiesterase
MNFRFVAPILLEFPTGVWGQIAHASWTVQPETSLSGMLDCLETADLTLVAAHRGGPSPGLPENAIETMDAVLAALPAIMEVDVGRTADGVHVLMHDRSLDRTTTGSGELAERDWAYVSTLQLLDADGWATPYRVPSLEQALAWSRGRTILQLDLKRSADRTEVVDLVRAAGLEDRIILIAYSIEDALDLHRLAPEALISLSIERPGVLAEAIAAGLRAENLVAFTGTRLARPDLYSALDEADVEVIFGTLGGPGSIDNMLADLGLDERYVELGEAGVDILATDRPRAAAEALEEAGRLPVAGSCGIDRR